MQAIMWQCYRMILMCLCTVRMHYCHSFLCGGRALWVAWLILTAFPAHTLHHVGHYYLLGPSSLLAKEWLLLSHSLTHSLTYSLSLLLYLILHFTIIISLQGNYLFLITPNSSWSMSIYQLLVIDCNYRKLPLIIKHMSLKAVSGPDTIAWTMPLKFSL